MILLFCGHILQAQNYVNYSLDKLENIYVFRLNSQISIEGDYGSYRLFQDYSGTAVNTSNHTFRDNETLLFESSHRLSQSVSFLTENNWVFASNSRQVGISDLDRKNLLGGFRYADSYFSAQALGGYERNEIVGIESNALIYEISSRLSGVSLGGYNLGLGMDYDKLSLNRSRVDSKLKMNAQVDKSFAMNDDLDMAFDYKRHELDNIIFFPGSSQNIDVENRMDNTFNAAVDLNVGLGVFFTANSAINVYNKNVKTSRNGEDSTEVLNFSTLEINELLLNVELSLDYIRDQYSQETGIRIGLNERENILVSNSGINTSLFEIERRKQSSQGYNTAITSIFTRLHYHPSRADSISSEVSLSVRKKDTPANNDDDRDELNAFMNISYHRKLSEILSFTLVSELVLTHEVFLKASKSANNNWKRIIRLSPQVEIQTKRLQMRPKFEVIANYQVFDFENFSQGLQSFSYREMNFRDSLQLKLNTKLSSKLRYYWRYFERGIFFWDEFAETPTRKGFDFFGNLLLSTKVSDEFEFGIGGRYSVSQQKDISNAILPKMVNEYESISPETEIIATFGSGNTLRINGWYEFRFSTNGKITNVPNVYLETYIFF